jgi:cysteine synthase
MQISQTVLDCIGNTPLIRLKRASESTGCEIYGKAEFMNPGGSVKDRAALGIIRAAEENGTLRPGGVVVEGTAGNTGIGLALVGNALGYRTVIVMPDNQSQEKVDALRAYAAEIRFVKPVPYRDDNHFIKVSGRLAEELNRTEPNGAIWANQFDNVANRDFHFATTGPEIWRQTKGKVDGFVCAVGSGGSLGGIAMYSPIRAARRYTTGSATASSRSRAARSPRASATAASRRTSRVRRSIGHSAYPILKRYRCFTT